MTVAAPALPLSALLRTATRPAHEHAETRPFVEALMQGRLGRAAYADLAAQHLVICRVLEAAGDALLAADPRAADVVDEALRRVPAIEADLAHLVGPDWPDRIDVLDAAHAYAARIADAGTWLGGYVAHAYTRYLGDLSGGQAIKAILQRSYGVPDEGVQFSTFPAIAKVKPYKDAYRARLDALPLTDEERAQVVAEAVVAFECNAAVFAGLAARHLPA